MFVGWIWIRWDTEQQIIHFKYPVLIKHGTIDIKQYVNTRESDHIWKKYSTYRSIPANTFKFRKKEMLPI